MWMADLHKLIDTVPPSLLAPTPMIGPTFDIRYKGDRLHTQNTSYYMAIYT